MTRARMNIPPDLQALLVELSQKRTRTPKGIFRYRSHEEANREQERWRALAVAARQSPDLHGAER